ncbi:MAG: cytochrome P450 [Acidimicrobiales bacterium]|nr:cytochrome P450 [Acidimicrobiales bacterium]MDP6297993.1 cytochrome P450 [Acidimicrobiales bacterium]HJM28446.1 cytochrome P450 [Acidimicrobiales bacterium]HJM96979.1 cytochrome P450 [Acidimicrobiales bacterium]
MENSERLYELRGREDWRNPYPSYKKLRDHDPVHHVNHERYGDFWVLSRFQDVFDAVRDTETFCSSKGLTPDVDAMDSFEGSAAPIVMMDPPEHTDFRRLVSHLMTPRKVAYIEDEIRSFVNTRLDEIEEHGEVDIVEELFKPLPSFVVAHYLGVPVTDRVLFDKWTNEIVAGNAEGELGNMSSTFELFEYASNLFDRRKSEPGEDLVSILAQAGESKVSTMWAVGFVFTMITGGNDTTTGLLGGAAELLTISRDQRQILIDNQMQIRESIDEFLRLTSPVQNLARTTTHDIGINGTIIPEGHKVMLLYASANRDEREFGFDSEVLNVRRKVKKMLSLGYGPHHCLGASVARTMGTVALECLLDRCPDFSVDAEKGRFAPGAFVRRYEYLPFSSGAHR